LSVHPDNWDFKTNRPKAKCPNRELLLEIILEKKIYPQNCNKQSFYPIAFFRKYSSNFATATAQKREVKYLKVQIFSILLWSTSQEVQT